MATSRLFADESSNNAGVFDAKAYKAAGSFVYASKATEGLNYINPLYASRADAAHAQKLKVIHYHFARVDEGNPVGQIDFLLRVIKPHFKAGDRVVLDIEELGQVNTATDNAWAHAAFAHLHANGHPGAPLYSDLGYIRAHGAAIVPPSGSLWVADFGPSNETPQALAAAVAKQLPGGHLWALQFTDGVHGPSPHELAGIGGTSDISLLSAGVVL